MAIARAITWMGMAQIATVSLQFASSVVLARFLTPSDMGIYAVAAATVGVLAIIQAFGMQALIVREEELTPAITTTAFTLNAAIAIALSASTALLSAAGGTLLQSDGVRRVMLALAVTPLFGILDFMPGARLERAGRFGILSATGVASGIAGTVVTIICAVMGERYMSAAYASWATGAVSAVLMNVFGRQFIQFRLGLAAWRRVADFGLQTLATTGLHSIGSRLSDLSLGYFQGLANLGIYNRASSLNGLFWNNIHLAVARVMLVDYAELNRQGVPLRERYIATVDVITAILWPAFAGLAVLAGPLIAAVYGHRWVFAAVPLAALSLGSIILVSITMTWEVFAATGNLRLQTRIEFYNAAFSTIAFVVGSVFGLFAAAASRVVSAAFAVLIYRPHLNRITNASSIDLLPFYLKNALLTMMAVGPALALMASYRFSPDAPLLPVLASVAVGVCLWVSGLFMLKHRLRDQLLAMLRRGQRPAAAV